MAWPQPILPFDAAPGAGHSGVWLVACDAGSWRTTRRLLQRQHVSFDSLDASPGIGRRDVVLLREPGTAGGFELFVPTCAPLPELSAAAWSATVGEWLARGTRQTARRSSELLLVGVAAARPETPAAGPTSTHLERLFARLAAPGLMAARRERRELCRSAWNAAPSSAAPAARALLRLEAQRGPPRDASSQAEDIEAYRTLREGGVAELLAHLRDQAAPPDERQLSLDVHPDAAASTARIRPARLGYSVRAVNAVRIGSCPALADDDRAVGSSRRPVCAVALPEADLVRALSGVSSRRLRLSAELSETGRACGDATLGVALDWELRTLLRLAGRCGTEEQFFDVVVSSDACEVFPTAARVKLGERRVFQVRPMGRRGLRLSVAAYNGRGMVIRETAEPPRPCAPARRAA